MFKKIALAIILSLVVFTSVYAEDTGVCGKSYMVTINYELYILKFQTSAFGPDCTGDAIFYWANQHKTYKFMTQNMFFVTLTGFGEFILKNNKLIYLDPTNIVMTEY